MKTEKHHSGEIPSQSTLKSCLEPFAYPKNLIGFAEPLSTWFAQNARNLPWRREPSLYRTVISEFMLQQTQVATVLPYFERWIQTLPDFEALAEASETTVVKLWQGLGYYTRARNLRKLAIQWIATPQKPQGVSAWLSYPGIGPYTAAAISSIAQGERAAVVDGNVVRILARLTNETRVFPDPASAIKTFTPMANSLIGVASSPGMHNEAMMELGATLCVRSKPHCLLCPVSTHCEGFRQKNSESLPKITRRKTIRKSVDRALCLHDQQILLYRHPEDARRLAGQYELPDVTVFNTKPTSKKLITQKSRSIANERILESIYAITMPPSQVTASKHPDRLHWVKQSELDQLILTGPHSKWLRQILTSE